MDLEKILKIPGWIFEDDIKAIQEISKSLPDAGVILEIGSAFGRSAVTWAQANPNLVIWCIDRFEGKDPEMNPERHQELFNENTSEYMNITSEKGVFSKEFELDSFLDPGKFIPFAEGEDHPGIDPNQRIHCVFYDADHSIGKTKEALDYFKGFDIPILCIDDYGNKEYPWIQQEVWDYCEQTNRTLQIFEDSKIVALIK